VARDIEANATINDRSSEGLTKFSENVRKTGKQTEKQFDESGKRSGANFVKSIGTVSSKVAGKLSESIGDGARLGSPLLLAGLASGLSAGLPALSGLIGAAVTGGAAGAGILGGVALAVQDSRVKAAGTQLGNNLLTGLQDRAGSFIQPVLGSIDLLQDKFLETGDTIERIFQNSSKFVEPLAASVGELAQDIVEGVDIAVGRAGPVMAALNEGLEGTGEAIKNFFDSTSANAEANAAVLDSTFDSLNGTIATVGSTLGLISSIFAEFDKIAPLSLFTSLNALFGETAEETQAAAAATQRQMDVMQRGGLTLEQYEKDQQLVNKALQDNAAAAQRATDAQQGLFSATTSYGEALDRAKVAADSNGATLSANTEKGRANRQALDSLASAYKRVIAEQEATGGSSAALSAKQTKLRGDVYAVALQMTGSAKKARELTNSLLGIPSPKPKVTLNTAGVAAQARNAREEINQIKGKTVTVTVNVNASRLAKVNAQLDRLQQAGRYGGMAGGFAAAGGDITSRVGGAATIEVAQSLAVNLDGRPFREMTARTVADSRDRERYRNRVGRRVDAS